MSYRVLLTWERLKLAVSEWALGDSFLRRFWFAFAVLLCIALVIDLAWRAVS